MILGVGLNINTLGFPDHLAGLATSLGSTTGRTYRLAIVRAFLGAMDRMDETFLAQGFGEILAALRREAETLGKPAPELPGPGSGVSGVRRDVAPDAGPAVEKPGWKWKIISGAETGSSAARAEDR